MSDFKKTILLVEDESLIAMMQHRILDTYGFQVILAETGEEAIKIIEEKPEIDLVLMDINLGHGMDGTEAAEIILKKHDLPLVFLSSHTEPEIVEKTEGITSYGYIVKNSGETVLIASIKMAFRLFDAKIKEYNKECALSESEARYRSLFDNISSGVAIYEQQNNAKSFIIKDFNNAGEVFNAVNKQDILGKNVLDVFPCIEEFGLLDVIKRVWKTGKSEHLPLAKYKDDRIEKYFDNFIYKLPSGEIVAVFNDLSEKKKLEESYELEKTFTQAIFDSIPGMLYLYDIEGHLIRWNKKHEALTGYSAEELSNMHLLDWYKDDISTQDKIKKAIDSLLTTGFSETEALLQKKDGSKIPLFLTASLLVINNRQYFTGIGIDISERLKIEETLKESEEHFRTLANSGQALIWTSDTNMKCTYFNNPWLTFTGRSLNQEIGDGWLEGLHPDDYDYCLSTYVTAFQKREIFSMEYRILHNSGKYRWIQDKGSPRYNLKGEFLGYIGHCWDITDLKLYEKALQESEEMFKNLFLHHSAVKFILDPENGDIIDANFAAADYYGWSREQLQQMNINQINTLTKDEIDKEMLEAKNLRKIYFNFKHKRADGSIRDVEVFSSRIDVKGQALLHSIIHDITERKQAEQELITLYSERELLLKEVHHRIKNNMYAVFGMLSMQASDCIDVYSKTVLNDAANRVQSMMVLYDKLYRSESFNELSADLYLNSLIEDILATYISPKKITAEIHIAEIKMNSKYLSTLGIIINELINNSIKYAFKEVSQPLISVSGYYSNDKYIIVYADNGCGLAEDIHPQNSKGFGMKLINLLIKQIKAELNIERDHGTRFIFSLQM